MSKGSAQRPMDKNKFDENFERIFGKPKDKVRVSGVPYEVEIDKPKKEEQCQQTSSSSPD